MTRSIKPVIAGKQMLNQHESAQNDAQLVLKGRIDRFSTYYFIVTFLVFTFICFGNELDRAFNLYILLVPILLIPAGILSISLLVSLGVSLFRRQWRRALSILCAPILAAGLLWGCAQAGLTPTWIRFQLTKSYFEDEVLRSSQQPPRLIAFPWGETGGAAVTNSIFTLVYDESDEIRLPIGMRSASWLERSRQDRRMRPIAAGIGVSDIRHLSGHFYAVTETY